MSSQTHTSLLEVVRACHNHDPWTDPDLRILYCERAGGARFPIGFTPEWLGREMLLAKEAAPAARTLFVNDTLRLSGDLASDSKSFNELTSGLLSSSGNETIQHVLQGWRNEAYAVYAPEREEKDASRRAVALQVERAACALFGFATFGVHCTVSWSRTL